MCTSLGNKFLVSTKVQSSLAKCIFYNNTSSHFTHTCVSFYTQRLSADTFSTCDKNIELFATATTNLLTHHPVLRGMYNVKFGP